MNKTLVELLKESTTSTALPLNSGATILINNGNQLYQIKISDFINEIEKKIKSKNQ